MNICHNCFFFFSSFSSSVLLKFSLNAKVSQMLKREILLIFRVFFLLLILHPQMKFLKRVLFSVSSPRLLLQGFYLPQEPPRGYPSSRKHPQGSHLPHPQARLKNKEFNMNSGYCLSFIVYLMFVYFRLFTFFVKFLVLLRVFMLVSC